ncbi:hypothetical protein BpHYR1_049663 [Brachionus plicatilis]|uniref:Uncharacterized protein n=1 Tax=Brachionus plicatilis TaxID=10195 RepID=A0A3M7R5A1_BRAPC|nr:hypothetical protein BpHYR1_049663 [Brachionus plicatilis]
MLLTKLKEIFDILIKYSIDFKIINPANWAWFWIFKLKLKIFHRCFLSQRYFLVIKSLSYSNNIDRQFFDKIKIFTQIDMIPLTTFIMNI